MVSIRAVLTMSSYLKLSRAWYKDFQPASNDVRKAIERTLPLLQDNPTAVPFVCRYRADVIEPLTTKHVHQLSDYIQKYESLSSLRNKIIPHLVESKKKQATADGKGVTMTKNTIDELLFRAETSVSKTELEDIYSPFKPPSKGSLEDRIRSKHPELVEAIDELWNTGHASKHVKLVPRDAAVTLLGNRIANDVTAMDAVMRFCKSSCKIQIKKASSKSSEGTRTSTAQPKSKKRKKSGDDEGIDKYSNYYDFENKLKFLRDHQVLAIRRGVGAKALKLTFDMDKDKIELIIRRTIPLSHGLCTDAIKDAYSRLIRKRVTSRLWKDCCSMAEARAIEVFSENLYNALLAPPEQSIDSLLALDPGFQAGIKCAILSSSGDVQQWDTVSFMGGARNGGKEKLKQLLDRTQKLSGGDANVCVVLGNGHGTREARELLNEAALDSGITVNINLVSEAGASVWSVTEMANKEFPDEAPAKIAAASIGRRFLNPLDELVKIPPRSLGLGMYQHDLSEKDLDRKLTATSIDAVAEVGVDVNSCSREILGKVPSLSSLLCQKIVNARPFSSRADLLTVGGLGEKIFENCAAFVRVSDGSEPLDSTLVHPESYDLARWLLKKLKYNLTDSSLMAKSISNVEKRQKKWKKVAEKASKKFDFPEDRVMKVIEQLFVSITSPDPRLRILGEGNTEETGGSSLPSQKLPSHISSLDDLRKSLPQRSISGSVRNIVDFGVFVDFGFENSGLLHRSNLGKLHLQSLLVGQELDVDVIGVSKTGKVALSVSGLDLPIQDMDRPKRK